MYAKYSSKFGKKLKFEGETIVKYETPISLFDRKNIDLSFDDKKKLLKKKFKESIIDLSKDNKIILLYPTPVSPEHIFYRILRSKSKLINPDFEIHLKNPDFYLVDKINYPVQFYREFFSEEISLFDSINSKNIYKGDMTVLQKNVCFHMIAVMQFDDWGVEASEAIRVTDNGSELFCNFPKELHIKS